MESIALLVAVAVLLPLVAGLICYFVRSSAVRTFTVVVTAIALIVSSLLLLQKGPFEYTPGPFMGMEWGTIIMVADMALLVVFLALGIYLKNVLVTVFAVAQGAIMGYV
ncbi:MAG TPA: NADH-quinone oxidoreductase subunit L, partial [Chloroflexota bacterium]|nr:NADH-quinone oxidoreductase subunit L [Chloroflexota bacterium]